MVFVLMMLLSNSFIFSQTVKVKKIKLSKIGESVFGPFYFNDSLFYSWDKSVNKSKTAINEDGTRFFDIFSVSVNESKVLSEPNPMSFGINSKLNDGPLSFSEDGRWVFYTRNLHAFNSKDVDEEELKLGVFYREINNGKYGEEQEFPFNSDSLNIAHPAINEDGTILVFSSDMRNSFGGADLFYSEKIDGNWTTPVNLGEKVNSSASESFPVLFQGTLYFTSAINADKTGLDIFKVPFTRVITENAIRLNEPLNSDKDDFGIAFINSVKGYFGTNRINNQDNIFYFETNLPKTDSTLIQDLKFCYSFVDSNLISVEGLKFNWDFGDGEVSNEKQARHCFRSVGKYPVVMGVEEIETGYKYPSAAIDTVVIGNKNFPSVFYDSQSFDVKVVDDLQSKKYTNFFWDIDGTKYFEKEITLKKKPKVINFVLWGGDYSSKVYAVKLIVE